MCLVSLPPFWVLTGFMRWVPGGVQGCGEGGGGVGEGPRTCLHLLGLVGMG